MNSAFMHALSLVMEEVMMEKVDELLSRVRASCLKPELPCMLMS